MRSVTAPDAPAPLGHYSHAIVHGGLVFVSGQLPLDPETGALAGESIEEQTAQTLRNLSAILAAAGSSRDKVIKTTVYIADIALWSRFDRAYEEFFGEHRPARAAVPTTALPKGALLEIEAVAATSPEKS